MMIHEVPKGGRQIKPLARSTFRDHISRELRNRILNGTYPPGSPLVEQQLAEQFGVSRGPLREAMRELVDEGLLAVRPYAGTCVIDLSVKDLREIHSMRLALESFAFTEAWGKRGPSFNREIERRHSIFVAAIDSKDEAGSILAELELHSLIYETAGHELLAKMWSMLRGRQQLYWIANHMAHGRRGPSRDSHVGYVAKAQGNDLNAVLAEVKRHMRQGSELTEAFLSRKAMSESLSKANKSLASR